MKKFLALSLTFVLLVSSFAFALTPAEEAGAELKALGLIKGDSAGNLNASQSLTREQAVATLVRMMGKTNEAASMKSKKEFSDVDVNHWAAKDLAYAKAQGWTKGIDEKKFGIGQQVTLQQYTTFMLRALGQTDAKVYTEALTRAEKQNLLTNMSVKSANANLNRGDAFIIMRNTLMAKPEKSEQILAEKLGLDGKILAKNSNAQGESKAMQTVYPLTITDSMGNKLSFDQAPTKVVCLYGSYADLWNEADGKLIGVIKSANLENLFKGATKVGGFNAPNVEAILALQPDLVILSSNVKKQKVIMPILEKSKIKMYDASCESLEDTDKIFKDFCAILDHNSIYENKMVPMLAKIKALKEQKKDFSYLLLFSSSRNINTKDDNIASEIIDNLGGKNITKSYKIADEESKQFSFEKILQADPDYVFIQTMGDVDKAKARMEKDIYSNPAWASLKAVKNNKVYYLPKDLFMFKPNLKYADAYQYMLDILEGKIKSDPQSK